MTDSIFKDLEEAIASAKAKEEEMTPEERNRFYAEEGIDCLASIEEALHETEEYFDCLLNNPLLDRDSERMISKLWIDIAEFIMKNGSHVERQLAHYIDEEEDIYG